MTQALDIIVIAIWSLPKRGGDPDASTGSIIAKDA
jgi:hypothetical protein